MHNNHFVVHLKLTQHSKSSIFQKNLKIPSQFSDRLKKKNPQVTGYISLKISIKSSLKKVDSVQHCAT